MNLITVLLLIQLVVKWKNRDDEKRTLRLGGLRWLKILVIREFAYEFGSIISWWIDFNVFIQFFVVDDLCVVWRKCWSVWCCVYYVRIGKREIW